MSPFFGIGIFMVGVFIGMGIGKKKIQTMLIKSINKKTSISYQKTKYVVVPKKEWDDAMTSLFEVQRLYNRN